MSKFDFFKDLAEQFDTLAHPYQGFQIPQESGSRRAICRLAISRKESKILSTGNFVEDFNIEIHPVVLVLRSDDPDKTAGTLWTVPPYEVMGMVKNPEYMEANSATMKQGKIVRSTIQQEIPSLQKYWATYLFSNPLIDEPTQDEKFFTFLLPLPKLMTKLPM